MKKLLCVLLAAAMMLSFTGCNIASLIGTLVDEPATEEKEEAPATLDVGSVEGNVYTNDYLDLSFKAPDGWTYASDEELAEMMEVSLDLVTDDESAQKLAELANVYGMMAQSEDQLNNVQLLFENQTVTGGKMTAEGYMKILSVQLDSIYADLGATCEVGEVETVTIRGNEYLYLDIAVDMGGMILEQGYACRKIDNYIVSIVITAYEEGGAKTILGYFE